MVTGLVCTKDRPQSLARAVRLLLQGERDGLEVIVVDQSEGPESERALAPFASHPALRYLRLPGRGKGAALNRGLREARGEIVVCTDDDCEAPPGWIRAMAQVLEEQRTAAVAFCNVVPVPYDRSAGYVPAYERKSSRLVRSLVATVTGRGIGAGMAVRRDVVLALGGFDESIGPGAHFRAGDDWDIANRVLLRGWHVYESAAVSIVHDGFRTFAQGREHARRDWYGMGAVCAKPLRAGHLSMAIPAAWLFARDAVWPPIADVLRLRKPRGLTRIVAFLQGFARGLRTPIDRETLVFRLR